MADTTHEFAITIYPTCPPTVNFYLFTLVGVDTTVHRQGSLRRNLLFVGTWMSARPSFHGSFSLVMDIRLPELHMPYLVLVIQVDTNETNFQLFCAISYVLAYMCLFYTPWMRCGQRFSHGREASLSLPK